MTRHPTFTEAEIARAIKAARATDPTATVEIVTLKGTIRIMSAESPQKDEFEAWNAKRENRA